MGFNKRKWWYFSNNKQIGIEIAGWKSHPSFYIKVDGSEDDVCFHLAFGFGIWITFSRFLPRSWYPTYESSYGHGRIGEEREISIAWHNGCFWWNFWISEEWSSWTKNKTWRKGCWHIVERLKGKHEYTETEISKDQFMLPFFEGIYNIEVIQLQRIDKWQRWFTSKMISWNVKAGYYNEEGKFIDKPIPVEGKGENSWDCDEDATYALYFPGMPHKKNIRTPYEAALYFWHSMMKDRERRGSANWVPKKYNKPLEILK